MGVPRMLVSVLKKHRKDFPFTDMGTGQTTPVKTEQRLGPQYVAPLTSQPTRFGLLSSVRPFQNEPSKMYSKGPLMKVHTDAHIIIS